MEREKASESWTNEKHSHYLDAMEASFVHTMLEDSSARRSLHLDRYVTTSCDSTQDSASRARNKCPGSTSGTGRTEANTDKRWRRHATDTSNDDSALDQVVPQISYKSDKVGKGR
ncbi:hypothetical protein MLD38_033552 [Melastoma candidum]|uniref:Uncharacterized protein n=1 Tax=Melastoma candidum TaxID=119954 RepID=A0ACB9M7Q3_9MYRT|nr:hypothetical protein MLD38_033552 [Melastoma candidum]